MAEMPHHIAKRIDDAKSYVAELHSALSEVSRLKMRPVAEKWPRIYMLSVCTQPFDLKTYDSEFDGNTHYKVQLGMHIIFYYDYAQGTFTEDSNFGDFSLFTYEDYVNNFEIIGYSDSLDEIVQICWTRATQRQLLAQ